jgi:hypothetical protein
MNIKAAVAASVPTGPATDNLADTDVVTVPGFPLDILVLLADGAIFASEGVADVAGEVLLVLCVEFARPFRVPTTHRETVCWSVKLPTEPRGVMVRL